MLVEMIRSDPRVIEIMKCEMRQAIEWLKSHRDELTRHRQAVVRLSLRIEMDRRTGF